MRERGREMEMSIEREREREREIRWGGRSGGRETRADISLAY